MHQRNTPIHPSLQDQSGRPSPAATPLELLLLKPAPWPITYCPRPQEESPLLAYFWGSSILSYSWSLESFNFSYTQHCHHPTWFIFYYTHIFHRTISCLGRSNHISGFLHSFHKCFACDRFLINIKLI